MSAAVIALWAVMTANMVQLILTVRAERRRRRQRRHEAEALDGAAKGLELIADGKVTDPLMLRYFAIELRAAAVRARIYSTRSLKELKRQEWAGPTPGTES